MKRSRTTPYLTSYVRLSPSLANAVRKIQDLFRKVDSRQVYSPQSHLHITVKELGGLGEDIKKENLAKVLKVIEEVARARAPFDLSVEGVGVFPAVIYGKVTEGANEIRQLNEELVKKLGSKVIQSEYDGAKMKPHVTMMHFATKDVGPLLREARRMATQPVGNMRVRRVQVRRREGRARRILATFELGR
jgi:2'-5' RNA ligase